MPPDINEALGRSDSQAQALEDAIVATFAGGRGLIQRVLGTHSQALEFQRVVEEADTGTPIAGRVRAALGRSDSDILALENAIALEGGGGGEEVLSFGAFGPAAPTVAGLTLAWDFDFGYEPLGPMRAEIPTRAGTDTTAFAHPLSPDVTVVAAGSTRAMRFDSAKSAIVSIRNGFTALNATDAAFTLVAIARRRSAGADQNLWDVHAGSDSGNAVETLNRYRARWVIGNTTQISRANAANMSSATLAGTPSLVVPNVLVMRGSLAADTISRGMLNGGAKGSTVARSVTEATWDYMTLGGRLMWSGTANGFPTWDQFGDLDFYRVLLYAGSGADADLDTLQTWGAASYPT